MCSMRGIAGSRGTGQPGHSFEDSTSLLLINRWAPSVADWTQNPGQVGRDGR
jgi:hypothetical protein